MVEEQAVGRDIVHGDAGELDAEGFGVHTGVEDFVRVEDVETIDIAKEDITGRLRDGGAGVEGGGMNIFLIVEAKVLAVGRIKDRYALVGGHPEIIALIGGDTQD